VVPTTSENFLSGSAKISQVVTLVTAGGSGPLDGLPWPATPLLLNTHLTTDVSILHQYLITAIKLQVKDVLPNIDRTQAAEMAEKCLFCS